MSSLSDSLQSGSGNMDAVPCLYFTLELRSGTVVLPCPPETLWFHFAGEREPEPAYLLTPATCARCWLQVVRLEARWARKAYPAEKLAEVVRRWQAIERFATGHLDQLELAEMKSVAQGGGLLPPLPVPIARAWAPW